MSAFAIEVQKITKRYRTKNFQKKTALDQVSLKVAPGEVFGFLGPNGAGKTTLIKILVGLMSANEGSARIFGHPCGHFLAKKKLGFLPESPYFHQFLTALEFLRFHGKLAELDGKALDRRMNLLFEKVGLKHAKNQPLRTYSKGMLQRLGFAQALLHDPDLLILDEPMTGLDPVGRREVRDIINQIAMGGKTVFFSTHIIHDVEVICTTVGFIKGGKLQGSGDIENLIGKTIKSMEVRFILPFGKDPHSFDLLSSSRKTMDGWVIDIEAHTDKLEEDVNHVLSKILKEKGVVRSVVPRKSTLEDLFFDGRPHSEHDA